jgi:acetyl-CoA synthetase
MLRTTYGDHDRCKQTYFSNFNGYYFTGDGVKRDEDGYYRILGRVDDVIIVSGHNKARASKLLGFGNPTTLTNWLKKYGVEG